MSPSKRRSMGPAGVSTRTGELTNPRATAIAAAPVEPVPLLIVSPAPRSQKRTSMVCSSTAFTNDTLVRLGNIHTANATLYTILLGSEDNGQTWREVHERVRGAGLDHIQFADVATGWTSGLAFGPLPQDPFLLLTTDGGKTWRAHAIFNEPRFGSIQQFFFEDKKSGSLVIDHGP